MSLPDNIKLPSYVKHRTIMGVLMIFPAMYGLFKILNAALVDPPLVGQFNIGIIIFVTSVLLMLVFTECKRVILKPTVFVQRDDVRTKLYVVHTYPERHWEGFTADDMHWIEVIKLFPGIYVSVGEAFKGSDSPFIRRHKDFS